ncbi:MAG: hypothetical protein K9G59_04635 [Caulobacter sp.]|nr:hypothetical protein [Caulobacter sp.]
MGDAIIELKALDEDGLDKPERRQKLADLFRHYQPDRPVIVLDPRELPDEGLRQYKTIMQGPIKNGIAHAKKQLRQSRVEHIDAKCSVLFLINNSYAALTHEELLALATERAQNDTSQIDVVVVAGCYFHSDSFDSYCLWPIDQAVIHPERPFAAYEALRKAWLALSERFMTDLIQGVAGSKGPVVDASFTLDGVTYVKPAPPIGGQSQFFVGGRPRKNSSGLESCPPVATTFPELSRTEWNRLRPVLADPEGVFSSYEAWLAFRGRAADSHRPLKPFVAVPVGRGSFEAWRRRHHAESSIASLMAHANDRFDRTVHQLIDAATEWVEGTPLPSRAMMVLTEIIGQDQANDISHIAVIEAKRGREPTARPLLSNIQMFHEYGVAVAAAYAVAEGITTVLWQHDKRHAWY